MKVKVGDFVVPRHQMGKIIGIDKQQVTIEWIDNQGIARKSFLTEEQAHLRGKKLDQHVDDSLVIVNEKLA